MENLEYYLAIAKDIAHQAGDLLAQGYGQSYGITKKGEGLYSIKKDIECNALYTNFLRAKTPEISLYTEEGEQSLGTDLVWVVDPLDGSSNYRMEIPLFVTQICLLYKQEPVVSVIFSPMFKQEFTATKGGGAFLNGNKIAVNNVSEMEKSLLVVSKGTSNVVAGKTISLFGDLVRTVRLFGATGMDLAYVAAGKSEITTNYGSQLWDYAPGVLLVREAGGLAMNFKGDPWTINDNSLVAANKYLMPKVLEIIKGV
jgi:myo-inositol-1(or 4)-monophosphatase